MRNNKGFSMIELLAAIVVLGILMGIAVPTVINVLNDRKRRMYVDDGLRLIANADNVIRKDNKIIIPPRGGCIVIGLGYVDDNTFSKGPYDGEYHKDYSFVVAKRNASDAEEEYTYYVRLIEKIGEDGDITYRGLNLVEEAKLYESEARNDYVDNVSNVDNFIGGLTDTSDKFDWSDEVYNELRALGAMDTICPSDKWSPDSIYFRK